MPRSLWNNASNLIGFGGAFKDAGLESEKGSDKDQWGGYANPQQEENQNGQETDSSGSSCHGQEDIEQGKHNDKYTRQGGGSHERVHFPVLGFGEFVES